MRNSVAIVVVSMLLGAAGVAGCEGSYNVPYSSPYSTTSYVAPVHPYVPPASVPRPTPQGFSASGATRYTIRENIDRGRKLLMTDGSLWEVDSFSRTDAMLWRPREEVTAVEIYGGYRVRFVNSDTGETAEAKRLRD